MDSRIAYRSAHFIDGAWTAPHGSGTIAVENPFTARVLAHVPAGDARDVDTAVAAARAAWPGWADLSPAARSAHAELAKLYLTMARRLQADSDQSWRDYAQKAANAAESGGSSSEANGILADANALLAGTLGCAASTSGA